MSQFTSDDLTLIKQQGISLDTIENQVNNFKNGFPFAQLLDAATPQKGLIQLDELTVKSYIEHFEVARLENDIIKFVPASGAASRMFKHLFEFRENLENLTYVELVEKGKHKDAKIFFENINQFAFWEDLSSLLENTNRADKTEYAKACLDLLLQADGLAYASLPKALLKFHRYENASRLAIEEHLVETAQYATSKNNSAILHFTVSPEHEENFQEILETLKPKYEEIFKIKYDISLSTQKSSTNTIAVDIDNKPFRDLKNQLVFRPAGHGALIENLNDLNADLIFVKNIDNVVTDIKREPTIIYKKALAGMGMQLQQKIFAHLRNLNNNSGIDEALQFIENKLGLQLPEKIGESSFQERIQYAFQTLNRPLRICGMVKNVGEPGGGPFWVNKNDEQSLQIVESAEIDIENPEQKKIMLEATHFNPVDLICLTKDYQGRQFNLNQFVDHNAAFISEKSKDGKTLKAMELPGLWNGAMAFWNTIFVEVPLESFNPVKTVNDLLREMHT